MLTDCLLVVVLIELSGRRWSLSPFAVDIENAGAGGRDKAMEMMAGA